MNWRRLNHRLHRDIGFLCIGMTLLYALSGIALNHMHDWNANYRIERFSLQIAPLPTGELDGAQIEQILHQLGETKISRQHFQPDPENLWLYPDRRMIRVHLPSGTVTGEKIARRPFWYHLNYLHLNHAKRAWTWMADLYASGLFLLALSGLFMLPQRADRRRRALILSLAGLLIPVLFLLIAA